jgi:HD-GYP domain-containing protein (c-di-GMP phosphodiesterase class II)
VRHHHERWDGTGYPDGLAGENIPIPARVFAVADTLDALTTDRPYRAASTWAQARLVIREQAGTQFDPAILAAYETVPDDAFARIREGLG